MKVFYVDEILTDGEESDVLAALAETTHKVDQLVYRRIPCVFPAESVPVKNEKMLDVLKGHVRNAKVPIGEQSILIIPKNGMRWGLLLQEAFYTVTGFYPFVIQPWEISSEGEGHSVNRRDYLHMIDMHSVMTNI
ncbi:hypothetical protein QN416_23320 [Glaciimonas sp. Cout2]|uniref:hypothetical protein n=1 Tax=Glaciimonas sp. Cout2 TaxID=3048621 RepID=UPI002B239229|nr:hypothetical protein [Glaciimonas sp. Cout2]MEB0014530.1 hypothetical protein [Glaciimonas sp. Cout2]